jgi:hypothetical protein
MARASPGRAGVPQAAQALLRRGGALHRTQIQAAWAAMCLVRTSDWVRRLAERRGQAVAAVALARRLAGILFTMWAPDALRGMAEAVAIPAVDATVATYTSWLRGRRGRRSADQAESVPSLRRAGRGRGRRVVARGRVTARRCRVRWRWSSCTHTS